MATGLFVAAGGYDAPQAHAQPAFPPPGPPVWSWTGFYAGVHASAVDGDINDEVAGRETETVVLDPNGVMGGVQAGYNFQIGRILLGIEGDIGFGDLDDRGKTSDGTVEAKTEWIATIRGRLGHSWDRTLIYVTGGVAFTELKIDYHYRFSAFDSFDHSGTESATGWTVGGGVEHALTDTVTLKAEYLYADFGKETFTFEDSRLTTTHDAELETHHFRVGVNLLF